MRKNIFLCILCFSLVFLAGGKKTETDELEELILSYKSQGVSISKEEFCQDYLDYVSQREYLHCGLAPNQVDCQSYVIKMTKLCLKTKGLEPNNDNVDKVMAKFLSEDIFCEFLQKKINEVSTESEKDVLNMLKVQFETAAKKKVNCAK
ncbi:MAG: hypothetical protein WC460_00275 [Patescibacteria group bacterium]